MTQAAYTEATGGIITIVHTVDGQPVASVYLHMWENGIHVAAGDTVTAGLHIGDVGSSGHSTGPHLDLEIHPGGADADPVDSDQWLTGHHADGITDGDAAETTPATCTMTGGDA